MGSSFFRKILIAFGILLTHVAQSQVKVSSTADTNIIRIGEQIGINLKATVPIGNSLSFPLIGDSIRKLEVVERGKIDTLSKKDAVSLELIQRITITAFDSGFYVLEPFKFILNGKDTLSTEAQLLEVRTIPVDTTKSIKDIKPIMEPPFDWRTLLPYLLGLMVAAIVAYFGYRYYQNSKKKQAAPATKPVPTKPPHETALEQLQELEREKLWQQGAYKAYHIRLTEIIREYIDGRYGINSMEMTTDETISALETAKIRGELVRPLEQLLRLADMVKFAKAIPVGPENEASILSAREFIRMTTPFESPKEVQS
ncbi:MAG: hypothetical protein ACKOQ6_06600 [Bacteroidota bacterium]